MNWNLLKIFLVTCAIVLCSAEDYSSEEDSYEGELGKSESKFELEKSVDHSESETEEDYSRDELDPDHDEYYDADDEEGRRKHHYHHHGHGSHHHGSHYVVPIPVVPKPTTTERPHVDPPKPKPEQNYCPPNEVWLDCYEAPPCDRECTSLGEPCGFATKVCNKGCFCRNGYARHPKTGNCVPISKCPAQKPQCSRNEQFQTCGYRCTEDCDGDYCKYDRRPCEEGCFCKPGYARVDDICVPRTSCKTCPAYERYLECGNSCMESCYEDSSKCRSCERSGCFCMEGYSRINGVCRPDSECPNRQCPFNEVYLDCGTSCQDNCDPTQSCTTECVRGCFCQKGYARINGKCTPRKECPVECPDNEHYESCGNTCSEKCDKDVSKSKCPPICIAGCYCDKGYARIDGKCEPRSMCRKCNLNEQYLTCGNACQDLCDPSAVTCSNECVEGCFCQNGYSRVNGVCVPRSKCFNCASGEEYTVCSNSCLERCDRKTIACPLNCEEGCFCAPGYSRINGQCVPDKFCPTCGANEEYQTCGNECIEQCGNPICPVEIGCTSGCFCKPGYKRVGESCVPQSKCPPECQGPNEVYMTCGNNCTKLCPDPNRLCTLECYNGCFCAEGYSRADYNSPCIPTKECPAPCSGQNEKFYECGSPCFENCPHSKVKCDIKCVTGCFCKPNHVRLVPDGPCVPETECLSPCTRPFEVLNNCGNNCTELCPRPGRPCEKNCWRGCFCKKGYYRAHYDGLCIPESKCPAPPVCTGPNEEVRDCSSPCDDDCPGANNECVFDCQVGCYCKPGFKRITKDGECVPEYQCNAKCSKANEEFTTCGSPCREKCPYPGALCSTKCLTGCYCKEGYSRINGECVPTEQCPEVCTGPNEIYTQCGNRCKEKCKKGYCPGGCEKGCFCEPGFSRIDGTCVPTEQCEPKCSDPNEEYTKCGNVCFEQCNSGACPEICQTGCFCKSGYKRDGSGGKCIPEKQCTPVCTKPNEEYTDCGNPCSEGCPYPTRVCPAVCYTGCYCKAGYSRIKGKCVPTSKCPNLCRNPFEVFSECGNHCSEKCNSEGCPTVCEVGCFCEPGYSRYKNSCIPTQKCPPQCSDPNEEYAKCGNSCKEKCNSGICPAICRTGCFCKEGYSRQDGICIPTNKCPSKCNDPNEEYTKCGNSCKEKCNSGFCPAICRTGCFCKPGYSRKDGVCIPTDECQPQCSDPNEEYTTCGNSCKEECNSQNCPAVCETGCFCKPGYSRKDGTCVPTKKCPRTCSDPNEQYLTCGNSCKEQCNSLYCPALCMRGCFCKEGYSRVDGSCVPSNQCPPQCSDPNEEYTKCGNSCKEKCNSGICPAICRTGCFCKPGYSRKDGVCIPTDECQPQCSDPNEEYTTCGNSCKEECNSQNCPAVCETGCFCKPGYSRKDGTCVPTKQCPRTCSDPNEQYLTCGNSCKEQCNSLYCPALCMRGCFCKEGYSRVDGSCVPSNQCPPQCSDPNEEYTKCGNSCKEKCNSGICPAICRTGCFCKPGYSRKDGVCIPTDECPPYCSDPNEEYTTCGNGCKEECNSQNCPAICETGCFCKPGYSRKDGTCVPTKQCPPTCSDPNEQYLTCGNSCKEQCNSIYCPALCMRGCFCREGYSRVDGSCVPSNQCPPQCSDPNEEYTKCGNSCTEKCNSGICPAICRTGCFCKPGYSRQDGVCIPTDECPPQCSDSNEEYTTCGNTCREQCNSQNCPAVCETGCFCKPGYSRMGESCIPSDECPACNDPNEEYIDCGNRCQEKCQSGNTICPLTCSPGCFCKEGYSRNNSVCILSTQCPTNCQDPNEIYSTCGSTCKERCGKRFCPSVCQTGCFCRPGYSRIQGVCTPTSSCPTCGENEEYTYCGSGCTDPCESRGKDCRDACQEGCFCKDNFSRITSDTPCVPDSQCPSLRTSLSTVTCGKNEVYTSCGRSCQTTCGNLGTSCQIVNVKCSDGCYCQDGYARIYEGGCCVKQELCPKTPCGNNEIWLECGEPKQRIPCPQNCQDVGKPCKTEYPICTADSTGGCYCKPGYSRPPGSTRCVPTNKCNSYPYWIFHMGLRDGFHI